MPWSDCCLSVVVVSSAPVVCRNPQCDNEEKAGFFDSVRDASMEPGKGRYLRVIEMKSKESTWRPQTTQTSTSVPSATN